MALEKKEETALLAYEAIRTGLIGPAEQGVTGCTEGLRWQLVPARVRHRQRRADALKQSVPVQNAVPVHTTTLFRQATPLDAIDMQHRSMRRKARPDARDRVLARKGQEIR